MFDFHSHILPNIDDGSRDLGESLELLKASKEQDIKAVVATPHFSSQIEDPETFFERRLEATKALLTVYDTDIHPKVYLGAEVAYYQGIQYSERIEVLRIIGTRLILIEMPFHRWTDKMVEDIVQMKQRLGLVPIIAHIERYAAVQNKEILHKLIYHGVLIQSNASFFIDKKTRKKALRMISLGQIQLLGSDMHNSDSRPQNLKLAEDIIREKLGDSVLKSLRSFGCEVLQGAVPIEYALEYSLKGES